MISCFANEMIRSGVLDSVAMKITGHQTSSTFRRYAIVDDEDLRAAIEKVSRATALRAFVAVTKTVTNGFRQEKRLSVGAPKAFNFVELKWLRGADLN